MEKHAAHSYPTKHVPKKGRQLGEKEEPEGVEENVEDKALPQCPICLVDLTTQEIGKPENCDHAFCLTCINEWSKNNDTCPVDRGKYAHVRVFDKVGGTFLRTIAVEIEPPAEDEIRGGDIGILVLDDSMLGLVDEYSESFELEDGTYDDFYPHLDYVITDEEEEDYVTMLEAFHIIDSSVVEDADYMDNVDDITYGMPWLDSENVD